MVMTILSLCAVSVPTVKAAASAGDLIKMEGNASVYYFDGAKRFVFPNQTTYMSWYNDFSGVITIPASELQSYPLGGNVVMRPGTKLVKITTDPSVYAVEPNGVLRKIQSEAQAASLYGTTWAQRVVDVPDAFFVNYTIGTALASGSVPAGSLVKAAGSAAVYYFDGTNYRSIASEAAMTANRFSFANVLTITNAITAGGNAISAMETGLVKTSQGGMTTGPVITGSGLMVSLSSATPMGASVPKNGSSIPMAKVNLTAANDGAVTLNSLTVKRIGLSTFEDIDKVWAEKDGVVIASKKSVNSNDEAVLVFSPALTINAGQTVSVTLLASLTATGGNIGLGIASASAVSATAASVTGAFPINGNLMSPTDYTVAELYVDAGDSSKTVSVGDEDIRFGKFDVNFATGTKDIILNTVSLKNTGSEDLIVAASNIYIENNGKKVATGVISGKYVNFTFDNGGYQMTKDNGDQTFYVKGDVIGKDIAGTAAGIKLELNKDTDMTGVEAANGFGIKINSSVAGTFSAVSVAELVINAGNIAVSKKSTSPSDTTVIKGSKAVVALLATLKADEAITADGLNVRVIQTNTNSFENVKVFLNGALVDSFDPTTATTDVLLDTSVYLKKGENEIKVTVDVKSNATNDHKFQAGLNLVASLLDTAEYELSGNTVTSNEITGTATGAIITVGGATLSAAKTDGYASTRNVVVGTSNISLGKFTVKAANDTVKITQIKVASTTGNTVAAANIYDMKIFVDGSQVGTTRNFTSTGATFSSLNISVADNATKVIELFGSIDNSADGDLKFEVEFTAEDSIGKTVSGIQKPVTSVFAVTENGSLNIAKDGDSVVSSILASKAGVEQEVATFKLTANNDSANVTELVIVNANESATTTLTTTDPRISSYKLYVEGNSSAIDTVTPFNGEAKFVLNNNQIVIPVDGSKKVTVKAVLNNIENDAAATDAYLKLQINSVKFKSSNGTETPLTQLSVQGNEFRIRKTAPTVALATLPSTNLISGNHVVSKFTVTADANADVKVAKLAIKYATSTNVDLANGTVKVNGVTKDGVTATVDATNKYIIVNFATSTAEVVSAGTFKTFEIVSNVTVGGTNSRESLSTFIEEGSYDVVAHGDYATTRAFIWSDSASNTDASNVWFNGWRVKGLSTDTQTMSAN